VRTDDFDYELPQELIAQSPVPRGTSRLLVLDRASGELEHRHIGNFVEYLRPDDLLLLNDTRVIPARLWAHRPTGRKFELLLLRALDGDAWEALLRPSARARIGERIVLSDGGVAIPEGRRGQGRWRVRFDPSLGLERLDRIGEMPLPPYIGRPEGGIEEDRRNYQTVYAAAPGAAAAPTAGLHFTEGHLQDIRDRGIEIASLTLHVGLGTFRPVSVENISDHEMHEEWYWLSEPTAVAVNTALEAGRRIVCVGTTSVRALEGALAAGKGRARTGDGLTRLFITPGYAFRGVGAMLTNFHLPRSTLLMMISALAGREKILDTYAKAIGRRYRFFSYGDAMLIV
jgi:S-adenosylmethionine:tRNA ribosyltransferase-isomerase